jgi:plasmid maintenance system antidote protein VapI
VIDAVWVAVCLPCWRQALGRSGKPPQQGGWPEEKCVLCGGRTNHGIYVADDELPAPPEPWDPDWVISPGETLRDWMEENHLSVRVTAKLCVMEPGELQRVLNAKRRITPTVAAKLAAGTNIPAQLWLNLERVYRDGLAAGKTDTSST